MNTEHKPVDKQNIDRRNFVKAGAAAMAFPMVNTLITPASHAQQNKRNIILS